MSFGYVEGQGDRDREGSMGRGEEGVGSIVNAHRRNARSPPSERHTTSPQTPCLTAANNHVYLCQLRTRTWSQAENTCSGSRMVAVGAAAAKPHYMAICLPPLPFLFTFSSIIILLCILSVLMKTDFVQHCILINQISKINKTSVS